MVASTALLSSAQEVVKPLVAFLVVSNEGLVVVRTLARPRGRR